MPAEPAVTAFAALGTGPSVDSSTWAPVRLSLATFLAPTLFGASFALMTDPFFSFGAVTALFLSCGVPTLLAAA